jgi:predicted SAM-dependent methyltransferase
MNQSTTSHFNSTQLNKRKLNLGCGHDLRDGYINVDLHARHNPDLVADITKLDMLPSASFDEIVAQDVLEHLERYRVQGALNEWSRLLANEGVLCVRVPSMEHMFKALCKPENRPVQKAEEMIHKIYGTQAYTGDYHLSGFTASLLESKLEIAGLQVCSAVIKWDMVYDIVARKHKGELEDPIEFIHQAYFKILGRAADISGLEHFSQRLQSGDLTREMVITTLEKSSECQFIKKYPSYLLPFCDVIQGNN